MPRLDIYLLGPPRVQLDGEALHIPRRKALALLAYLAVERHAHRRDSLAALLWSEYDQSGARGRLRRTLSSLNRILGEGYLDADRETVGLRQAQDRLFRKAQPEPELWLDVDAFRRDLSASEKHGHPADAACAECQEWLEEAVALYRDDFLAGFSLPDSLAFDEWARFQTEGLRDQLSKALDCLSGVLSAQGEHERAISHARRRVELEPIHEPAHRTLMDTYARAGRRGAALLQYRKCVRILEAELQLPPSLETTALYDQIRAQETRPAQAYTAPVEALLEILPSHNLPARPNSFIGRVHELADLLNLIRDPAVRLVSVVGAGGMGKTRLALQVAADAVAEFPEGAWLVELARVTGSDAVPLAVARALGVQPHPDRDLTDTLVDGLGTREILLVLDNCEHVLDGVVPLVSHLLSRCPQLTVMITSREALHVQGERLYDLPPMQVPTLDAQLDHVPAVEAVRLFVERAQDVRFGFTLTEDNADDVASICRRLDGIPLAIELAAARLRAFSPREIALRLDDRFRLLTGGARTLPPRQQTLLNSVIWSYELLEEDERALFDRLSVFRGGFTLEAAETICAGDGVAREQVLDLLVGLVDKSLVTASQTDPRTTRYRLLVTLRQFGARQLDGHGDTEAVRSRHAAYFTAFAEETEILLNEAEDWATLFKQLDTEADNLSAAMRWSLSSGEPLFALRMGCSLALWLMMRLQFGQFAEWLEKAIELTEVAPLLYRAKALDALARYQWQLRRFDQAANLATEGMAAARKAQDPRQIAQALVTMGNVAFFTAARQDQRSSVYYQECLEIAQDIGDQKLYVDAAANLALAGNLAESQTILEELLLDAPYSQQAQLLEWLAGIYVGLGDLNAATVPYWRSFERYGEMDAQSAQATVLCNLGVVSLVQGDYARAQQLLQWGEQLSRRCGYALVLIRATVHLGEEAWCRGESPAAESRWLEALDLARRHKSPFHIAATRRFLSYVASDRGDFDAAEELCIASQETFAELSETVHGLANLALARVALLRGEPSRSAGLFRSGLTLMHRLRGWIDTIRGLEGLTWAYAALQRYEEAAKILSFVATELKRSGMILPPVDQPHHERALRLAREALGEKGFAAAWESGGALTLEEAVDFALTMSP